MSAERPDDARVTCANCGARLQGPFCHACGQKDLGTRVELRELVAEVVSETFEIEGRLPRTLFSVLWRPGHYLGEYLAGRRRSYASPLRFYLLMLFISALTIGLVGEGLSSKTSMQVGEIEVTSEGIHAEFGIFGPLPDLHPARPRLEGCFPDLDVLPWLPECEQRFGEPLLYTLERDRTLECPIYEDSFDGRVARALQNLTDELGPLGAIATLHQGVLQQVPLVLSLLVALQALVLKGLWFRHHTSTHVLVALVLHTLWLVGLTVTVLAPYIWLGLLVLVWHQLHVVLGLRRAYGSGWLRTAFAYVVVSGVWGMTAVLGLVLAYGLALWTLSQPFA